MVIFPNSEYLKNVNEYKNHFHVHLQTQNHACMAQLSTLHHKVTYKKLLTQHLSENSAFMHLEHAMNLELNEVMFLGGTFTTFHE